MGAKQISSKKIKSSLKKEYVSMLRRKRKKFIIHEKREKRMHMFANKLSFLSEAGTDDVDWKIFVEDYLEDIKEICFWADPLLK